MNFKYEKKEGKGFIAHLSRVCNTLQPANANSPYFFRSQMIKNGIFLVVSAPCRMEMDRENHECVLNL